MSGLQGEGFIGALAGTRARIGQLERDAIMRSGEAEERLRADVDRYKSLVTLGQGAHP